MTEFEATYQSTGQPKSFLASVEVKEGDGSYGRPTSRSTTRSGCTTPTCT